MEALKLIKASAGSGKTYTLTNEYLKLLSKKERAYRNILAVTFTNKATEEMKSRVVKRLHEQSIADSSAAKQLSQILHDYSSFSISTIDRFFQQTMRAFAREIGKNSAYSIELDVDMVLQEAIDNMIYNLDKEESRYLLEWLMAIGVEMVERGEGWNFRKKLEELAKEIFKDSFKQLTNSMEIEVDKAEIEILRKELVAMVKSFQERVKSISNKALDCIASYDLELSQFMGGTRTPLLFFVRVLEGEVPQLKERLREMALSPEALISNSTARKDPALANLVEQCWSGGLAEAIEELSLLYDSSYRNYQSAITVLSNLQIMGLIVDVAKFVNEYTTQHNVVLIQETTSLLNKIIDGSTTPFIYEKTGTTIDHFMLDEFQDTSVLQWQNFLPLIVESLSKGMESLIVGDVKQSIYRWRGSDWSLLNSGIYKDLPKESIAELELKQNWRSSQNIVEFNNRFFPFAGRFCENEISKEEVAVFTNAVQEISPQERESEGYVWVKFMEKSEEKDWKMGSLELSIEKMKGCIERGVKMSDITYLVRTNNEGQIVVNELLKNGFPVISDEALYIGSASIIKKVISILKYIVEPEDSINNAIARFLGVKASDALSLSHLPLYELCQEAILLLEKNFNESDSVFINSFLDVVLEKGKDELADASSFVKWWEEGGYKTSLSAPLGQNAVRVMTIHKAKGLGISVVFLPFYELPLDHRGNQGPILWPAPKEEPFSRFSALPVKYSSKLRDTIFEEDYVKERRASFVDNLNLAYVAMTRAQNEIYIFASPLPKKGDSFSLSVIMGAFLREMGLDNEYELGKPPLYSFSTKTTKVEGASLPNFVSYNIGDRIKLSLRGEEFYSDTSRRGWGVIMHRVMELIECEDDLDRALDSVVSQGILQFQLREEVREYVVKMFSSVRDRHWFDNSFRVYRELEILLPEGGIKRPDRVLMAGEAQVIDFKFGERREERHINQVRQYMSLIKESGIAYVKGFVWYPDNNEIIEV